MYVYCNSKYSISKHSVFKTQNEQISAKSVLSPDIKLYRRPTLDKIFEELNGSLASDRKLASGSNNKTSVLKKIHTCMSQHSIFGTYRIREQMGSLVIAVTATCTYQESGKRNAPTY